VAHCEETRPLLGAYADGELDPIESDAVVAHLQQCGRCRQVVRDQQQAQHVFDSYQPPPVAASEWAEIGRRLRAELEGKGEPRVLKTRSRSEALEPTPVSTPALRPDEVRSARAAPADRSEFRRDPDLKRPPSRPWAAAPPAAAPLAILRPKPTRRHARNAWVAHAFGAAAAVFVVFLSLASPWLTPDDETIAPIVLAKPQDVIIMDIQTMDPDYNVVLYAGDAADVAAIWVILNRRDQG